MHATLLVIVGVALSFGLPHEVDAAVLTQPGSHYSEFRLADEPVALGEDARLTQVPLPAGIALFGAAVASVALWRVGAARRPPSRLVQGTSRKK